MSNFQYRGRNQQSELVSGYFEADNAEAVAAYLMSNGIIPIDIVRSRRNGASRSWSKIDLFKKKVTHDDLIFFCNQMYTLLRAGVPILEALKGLHESTPSEALGNEIGNVRTGLETGLELSVSLRHHSNVFSDLFIGMVEVGESSGMLQETFKQLSSYLERERDTRSKIKAAMRYPSLVIGAIAIAMVIMNIFVIPIFAEMYAKFNAELPLVTQILIMISDITIQYWYVLLSLLAASFYSITKYIKTPVGRATWHRYKLKIPIVGNILYCAALSRFAHTLAVTEKAGVPWGKGMTVVSTAVDNDYIGKHVLKMRDSVEEGVSITQTATASGLFPKLVLQMLNVGEQSGALEELLTQVAEYYDREVDYRLKMISSSIEPLLLGVMGLLVLIFALGVFMPMWDLGSAAIQR